MHEGPSHKKKHIQQQGSRFKSLEEGTNIKSPEGKEKSSYTQKCRLVWNMLYDVSSQEGSYRIVSDRLLNCHDSHCTKENWLTREVGPNYYHKHFALESMRFFRRESSENKIQDLAAHMLHIYRHASEISQIFHPQNCHMHI